MKRPTLENAINLAIDLRQTEERIQSLVDGLDGYDRIRAKVMDVLEDWGQRYACGIPSAGLLADDIADALTEES